MTISVTWIAVLLVSLAYKSLTQAQGITRVCLLYLTRFEAHNPETQLDNIDDKHKLMTDLVVDFNGWQTSGYSYRLF